MFGQFTFQLLSILAELAGLLLHTFPQFDFLAQRVGQPLDSLQKVRLGCLQFLGPDQQPGLFSTRFIRLGLQLLLHAVQFLPQRLLPLLMFRELRFQFGASLPKLDRLLLGAFPPGVEVRRLGLAEAVANTRAFLSPSNNDSESEFSRGSIIE